MRQTLVGFLRNLVYASIVVCCLAITARAQFKAGIEGTVTDTSGAVVGGVAITVTDQETGKSEQTTADSSGFYSVSNLAPGKYTISASFSGFTTKVIKDVDVSAETVQGVNLVLEPGVQATQVTVTGETIPALQTEDATISGTITSQDVTQLPIFAGDPLELLRITPGVFGQGSVGSAGNPQNLPGYSGVGASQRGVFQTENAVQASANGSRVESNGFLMDGVTTNSQNWGGATVVTPNAESVKEINVDVSNYSAETPYGAGATVQVVTQNGTNHYHGSLVLRVDTPGLNAYQKWGGPFGPPNRNNLLTHNVLGSIGGPILKDKLFVFYSFEHLKTGGATYNAQSWAETSQWIGKLPSGSLAAKIFSVPGTAFPNATILTASSTCANLGLTEGPNCATVSGGVDLGSNTGSSGTVVNSQNGGGLDGSPDVAYYNYTGFGDNIKALQHNGRLDFNATSKDTITFSLFYVPLSDVFHPGGWVDGRQYDVFKHVSLNETAALLWTHTISPTMVNEARANVTRWYFDEIKSNTQAPWGVPMVHMNIPNNSVSAGFFTAPGVFYQTTYTFRDTLSKVRNNHVMKFGGDFDRRQNNTVFAGNAIPNFNFNNLWSFANDAPIEEYATFNPQTGVPTDFSKNLRGNTVSFFAQDNWKYKPNLTLTYGLRYDYFSPLRDKYNNFSNFIPGSGSSALTGGSIKTGGDFTNPQHWNFGPELGFAWSPRNLIGHDFGNRFVLRGGIGLSYHADPFSLFLCGCGAAGNPPADVFADIHQQNEILYAPSAGGNYSFGGYPANPATTLTFNSNGIPIGGQYLAKPSIQGAILDLKTPYTWHYSMQGQYDVGHGWVASVSYEGNQSRHYARMLNYAQFFPQNPNLASVVMVQSDVNAHYNALLLAATHRLSKGLEASFNYRFSRSTDTCSGDGGCNQTYPFSQATEIGPSDYDATHTITAYAVWELPFFRERHDWKRDIVGGWTLSPIFSYNSGFPWEPTFTYVGNACNYLETNFNYTNNFVNNCTVRAQSYTGGGGSKYSASTFQMKGGNFPNGPLSYFTPPPNPSTFVNGVFPAPTVGRNTFRGPHFSDIDLSLGKRFTLPKLPVLGENTGLELKVNAFNLFNKLDVSPFGFNSGSTQIGTGDCTDSTCSTFNVNPNPNFGRGLSALGGRTVELYARFSF